MRPTRILLVEDDPADVLLIRRALSKTALRVDLSVAVDGEDAMAYLRREGGYANAVRPDLMLVDLNMPRKGGLVLLREVKQDPGLWSIPVVVLTTSDDPGDIRRAYANNANSYVIKPSTLSAFNHTIHEISRFWFSVARLER